jgi:D-arabinose 1-dehydrogenase-like Zn-dependent alcohol dehydrogenase
MARSANDLVTKIRQLNQTYKRLLKGDVKYRFVIDKWTP